MTRADYLLRPVVLAGLILWIVNDHVLKAAFASWSQSTREERLDLLQDEGVILAMPEITISQ